MILNLGSAIFHTETITGGGTPAWGTEMGQGEGYRFNFEDYQDFITALVYKSIPNPKNRVSCPLGKGGNQADDYEFVIASLFDKIFVNGLFVKDARFVLLVVKKLIGEHHIGRRTLKYNPRITLDGDNFNSHCFDLIASKIGVSPTGSWFISEINVRNQDELHFTAHILDANHTYSFADSTDRSTTLASKIMAYAESHHHNDLKRFADWIGDRTLQRIYYGCPGSGKSYKVKEITEKVDENFVFRTTFHPDTDYASFVGCYKPISNSRGLLNGNDLTEDELLQCFFDSKDESKYKGDIKARYFYEYLINTSDIRRLGLNATDISKKLEEKGFDKTRYIEASLMGKVYDWLHEDGYVPEESTIAYKFCPQVFTNAYVQAWKNPEEKVYLIIEEINRGNCAQIFGDLFQLLDRDKTGKSEYPIKADRDLAEYLRKVLAVTGCEGIEGGKLCLPSNLIIYATMNTSDQSLFPMDSAFKRRWDWEYVPIEYEAVKSDGKPNESYNYIITIDDEHKYRWVEFLKLVNEKIYDTTRSEDKQMGNFFIKESIGADAFVNKVMFYLWNEVCKEEYGTTRNFFRFAVEGDKDGKEFKFVDLFDKDKITNLLIGFMNHLKVG